MKENVLEPVTCEREQERMRNSDHVTMGDFLPTSILTFEATLVVRRQLAENIYKADFYSHPKSATILRSLIGQCRVLCPFNHLRKDWYSLVIADQVVTGLNPPL